MVCGHVHFSLSWIQVRPRRPTAGRHQDAPCADHEPQPHGTGIGANRPGLQMRVAGSALAWDCHGLSGHGAIRDGRNPGTANASGHDPPLRRGSGNFHGNKPSIVNQWKSYCTGGFPNGPRRSRIYGGSGRVRSPPSEFHQPTNSNTGCGPRDAQKVRRKPVCDALADSPFTPPCPGPGLPHTGIERTPRIKTAQTSPGGSANLAEGTRSELRSSDRLYLRPGAGAQAGRRDSEWHRGQARAWLPPGHRRRGPDAGPRTTACGRGPQHDGG